MRKILVMLTLTLASYTSAYSQDLSYTCPRDTILACGNPCLTITSRIPDIKSLAADYTIRNITPQTQCYPIIDPGSPGPSANLSIDDRYSAVINLPFAFPFYGTTYNSLVISTNGLVSFDATLSGAFSHWQDRGDLPNTQYDRALIMGPYHDLQPGVTTSPTQQIKYNTIGTAPNRKWVLSYYRVPLFSCNNLFENTHQIILYESSGIIEVFIQDKEFCLNWEDGKAMVGIQNFDRTMAVMAPNRRHSDPPWGTIGMNETWRFIPKNGPTTYRGVELLDGAGTVVAVGDTTRVDDATLSVAFPNVCPPANTTTTYVVKTTYANISNLATTYYSLDTIFVTRQNSLPLDTTTTPTDCGAATGTINVTASGGTPPYQYSINFGAYQGSGLFTGLAAGTYNIVGMDATGCTDTIQVPIIPLANIPGSATSQPTGCPGVDNGTITVNVTGGTGPYTYSLDGGAPGTSNVITGVAAGPHTIVFTDVNGCTGVVNTTVGAGSSITSTSSTSSASCAGASDGSVTITPTSGSGPYTFSLNGGPFVSTNVFTGLASGSHSVTIRDNSGCTGTRSFFISAGGGINAGVTSTPESCPGAANGTITVTTNNGTAPFSFVLDGGTPQASNIFTSVTSGLRNILVTDANGCTYTQTIPVSVGTGLTDVTATSSPTACPGIDNGSIEVTATGGTAPYQYSLDGVTFQASNIFNAVGAGTHTVTVRDANGCSRTTDITVDAGTVINGTATTTPTACPGVSNGSITVTPTNGTAPYEYSIDGVTFQTSNTFTGVGEGTHTITIRDASGCTGPVSATVDPGTIINGTFTATPTACPGVDNGTITITPTNGTAPYEYSLDGVTYQTSNTLTGVGAGAHTVYIRDANGCIGPVDANVPAGLTITGTAVGGTTACPGVNNGTITVTPSSGTAPHEFSADGITFQTSNILTGFAPGTHTVYIRDANGCIGPVDATVTEGDNLTGSTTPIATACPGAANGGLEVTVTNGTAPYQYSADGVTFQASNILTGFAAGTHTVTVRDANGCTGVITGTVTDGDDLIATAVGSPTACPGVDNGSITVTPTNGSAPYEYSLDGTTFQTGATFNGLAPGTYTITIRDAFGCVGTAQATVTTGTNIDGDAVSDASSCTVAANGTITASTNNGTAPFTYSLDNVTFQPSNIFTGLLAGNYTVYFNDATGCTGSTTVTVSAGTGLEGTASTTSASCPGINNGAIEITLTPGIGTAPFTYALDGGAAQASNIFNGVSGGNHTVVVTDSWGCDVTIDAVVDPGTPITGTAATTGASCPGVNNGEVTITPGATATAPFTFSLDGGAAQAGGTFMALSAGDHSVAITDANGCSVDVDFNITSGIVITAQPENIIAATCTAANNGGVTIVPDANATAPFTYSMDGGAAQASATFTGLSSGNHTAIFTDANGCVGTVDFVVPTEPPFPATATSIAASCAAVSNGSITVTPNGGSAPYQYILDGGTPQASPTFNGLAAGNYMLQVLDALGCISANVPIAVNANADITLAATPTDATCPGVDNGSVELVPGSTAVAPFTFSVNGGPAQASAVFNGLATGSHTGIVTDGNGCSASVTFTVGVGADLDADTAPTETSCPGVNNGTITVTPTSGTGPYLYSLDGGAPQANATFNNLAPGTYTITFTDAIGCSGTVTETVPEGVSISSDVQTDQPVCNGINDGIITVTPTSGVGPYTFAINGGAAQASGTFASLAPGNYDIVITDGVGCTGTNNAVLVTNPALAAGTVDSNPLCFGSTDGTIEVQVTGGVAPYQYSLDGGANYQTTNTFTALAQGAYNIRILDNVGCTLDISTSLTQPTLLTAVSATTPSTCEGGDGTITITANGGTQPYLYSLDNGATFPFQSLNVFTVGKGTYPSIAVKDDNGCVFTLSDIVGEVDVMGTLTIGNDTTVCQGQPVTFNPDVHPNASIFLWTPDVQLDNNTLLNATATPDDTTTYVLTARWGACERTDSITINVLLRPIPDAGPDQMICLHDSTTISGSVSHTSGTVNYTWAPADLVHDDSTQTTIAVPGGTQTYVLTVTDNYGCDFRVSDSVNIIMQPAVPAYAGGDTIVTINHSFNLRATGGEQYIWSTTSPNATIDNPNVQMPLVTATEDARYMVEVRDIANCVGYDTVYVQVMVGPTYYVPNAFSPNGDGLNDVFRPIPVGVTRPEYFRVFNRFGQVVFETNQYLKGWDGTYKGQLQPMGAYVWILRGEDKNGRKVEMKGTVMLVQ